MLKTTRVASFALLLVSAAALAGKPVFVGNTYPIAEPDVLAEIQQQAATKDWKKWMRRAPADYSAFSSMPLPRATRSQSYLFDPTYTLPHDIKDATGKILFPAGMRVNVYERIKAPGRYIVIGPEPQDFAWLAEVAKPGPRDKVLLAGGNTLNVRQQRGVKVFQLDERFIERFGLRAVPSIVQQEGKQLRVSEYLLEAPKKEGP